MLSRPGLFRRVSMHNTRAYLFGWEVCHCFKQCSEPRPSGSGHHSTDNSFSSSEPRAQASGSKHQRSIQKERPTSEKCATASCSAQSRARQEAVIIRQTTPSPHQSPERKRAGPNTNDLSRKNAPPQKSVPLLQVVRIRLHRSMESCHSPPIPARLRSGLRSRPRENSCGPSGVGVQ